MDKSSRELLVEMLLSDETIKQEDIAALEMFNSHYIHLLVQLPQKDLKQKIAEMLVMPAVTEFKVEPVAYA